MKRTKAIIEPYVWDGVPMMFGGNPRRVVIDGQLTDPLVEVNHRIVRAWRWLWRCRENERVVRAARAEAA